MAKYSILPTSPLPSHPGPPAGRLLALAVCLLAAACVPRAATPPPPPPDLVLVVIDTLRADRLDFGGHHRPTSPHLDRLAGESVVFHQARAVAPCTFPSVNALLTSRPGWEFLAQPFAHLGIPRGVPTLAQELRRAGYRTVAVAAGDPKPAAERLYRGGDAGLAAADLAHLSDRYDEEVAFADARLGDLLEADGGRLRRSRDAERRLRALGYLR